MMEGNVWAEASSGWGRCLNESGFAQGQFSADVTHEHKGLGEKSYYTFGLCFLGGNKGGGRRVNESF